LFYFFLERVTRTGRVFSPFLLDGAIVVPRRRIHDLLMRHAEAMHDDGDSNLESDYEGANSDADYIDDEDEWTSSSSALPAPSSSPPRKCKRKLAVDFELPSSPAKKARAGPAGDLLATPVDRAALKKAKKTQASRERRKAKREAIRASTATGQKAINLALKGKSVPVPVPIRFAEHTHPIASSSWMGLKDTAIEAAALRDGNDNFALPEACAYTYDEIMDPSMDVHYIDWDGCVLPSLPIRP
jgi:hypothetical protein